MKRTPSVVMAFALALVSLGGCDGGIDYEYRHPRHRVACGTLARCEACTPVVGCGWCQLSPTVGVCTDGPDDCPPAPLASWTWEPALCSRDAGVPADASVATRDAQRGGADVDGPSPRDGAPAP